MSELALDDPRWTELLGGYRRPYDPRPLLARIEAGDDVDGSWRELWRELWQELHHQGDVDLASYAAVPHLVRAHRARDSADWNTYGLMGAIEIARHQPGNPAMPEWLASGYDASWTDAVDLALRDLARSDDDDLVRSALGVIALARGLRRVGDVLLTFTDDELDAMIADHRAR